MSGVILALITSAAVASLATASPFQRWRDMMPAGATITALGYGAGNFRAFSASGFAYSSNAIEWSEVAAPTNRYIGGVSFGNNVFIAAGFEPGFSAPYQLRRPLVLQSTNGMEWASQQLPGEELRGVAFGNGAFVAVGNNTILASTNGSSWSSTKPLGEFLQLGNVEFVGDRFVALGNFGLVLESTNGMAWSDLSVPTTSYLFAAAHGDGATVVVGENGTIFRRTGTGGWGAVGPAAERKYIDIAHGNGRFVAVGALDFIGLSAIQVSTNGLDWTDIQPGRFHALYRVTFAEGQFVAAGENGTILTSTNGIDWTIRRGGVPTILWSLAEGDGLVVAAGGFYNGVGTVLTSSGDRTWQSQAYTNDNYPLRLLHTNGTFLTTGSGGFVSISPDGTNWTAHPSALNSWLFDLIYARGVYVSAAGNRAQWSTNGVEWNSTIASTDSNAQFRCLAFGNERFVLLGQSGHVAVSSNLVDWVGRTTASTQFVNSVTFGNGVFVAVGDAGIVLRSSDGLTWSSETATTNHLHRVRFMLGHFVAVGSRGTILSSVDGAVWDRFTDVPVTDLYDVALVEERLWAAGVGTILVSDPLAPCLRAPQRLPDGRFQFDVDWVVRPCRLQESADGHSWTPVPDFELTWNGTRTTVTSDTNAALRMFRAVIEN